MIASRFRTFHPASCVTGSGLRTNRSSDMTTDRLDIDRDPKLRGNARGTEGHYSGEEYDSHAKEQPRTVEVGASRGNREAVPAAATGPSGADIPTDAGSRAFIDEKTGE